VPIQIKEEDGGKLVAVQVTGKLVKADYECCVPDFHGWEAGALWSEIKLDIKYFADIERLAVVGDKKWEQSMVTFFKPFTKATTRYFNQADAVEARMWLREGQPDIVAA
jgi:hypothetical protein